jgi:hypothetical protein
MFQRGATARSWEGLFTLPNRPDRRNRVRVAPDFRFWVLNATALAVASESAGRRAWSETN